MMKRILSLGAGVQSSMVFLKACRGEWEHPLDGAIFADPGWEPAAVYKWMTDVLQPAADEAGIPIYQVSKGNIRDDALISGMTGRAGGNQRWVSIPYFTRNPETGKRGMIRRQCTTEYKIDPVHQKIRKLLGLKFRQKAKPGIQIQLWFGISADEAQRMRDSRYHFVENYYPLIEHDPPLKRQDCIRWIQDHGYGDPPRSACIGCPYRSKAEWVEMKKTNPVEFQDAVEFDQAIRKTGGSAGDVYLHDSLTPLGDVDFRSDVDKGQSLMFGEECEGMCGT